MIEKTGFQNNKKQSSRPFRAHEINFSIFLPFNHCFSHLVNFSILSPLRWEKSVKYRAHFSSGMIPAEFWQRGISFESNLKGLKKYDENLNRGSRKRLIYAEQKSLVNRNSS